MPNRTRLSNDEFIALRSIHRDPWASGAGFQWKQRKVWLDVDEDGWTRRVGTNGAYRWRSDLATRGQTARELLLARGLAQEEEVRCCNGACGKPGWVLTTLTPNGKSLMAVLGRHAARDVTDREDAAAARRAAAKPSPIASLKNFLFG